MNNIKYLLIVMIAFLIGAQSNFNQAFDEKIQPKSFSKDSYKVLVEHAKGCYLIEVNSIPEPFDIAGSRPYVLWVNGERFNVPKQDLKNIIEKVGRENIPPIDRNDIHKGWMRSFFENPKTINDLLANSKHIQ